MASTDLVAESLCTADAVEPRAAWWQWPALYMELAKARLVSLVLVTAAIGFALAGEPLRWGLLAWMLLGTGLAAGGANGLNQWLEVSHDSRMARTCRRPLPTLRLGERHALVVSLLWATGGVTVLAATAGALPAILGAAAVLIYVLAYTPLKRRSSLCMHVGAVVGALPPMIGWSAAAGTLGTGAWLLGAILFIWQIPHSLALGWLCRDDYARGGFRLLPVIDPDGRTTARMSVLYCLGLLPVTLAVALAGISGWVYALGALVLGAGLLGFGRRMQRTRSDRDARRLFLATIAYLPLLLGLMWLDHG